MEVLNKELDAALLKEPRSGLRLGLMVISQGQREIRGLSVGVARGGSGWSLQIYPLQIEC